MKLADIVVGEDYEYVRGRGRGSRATVLRTGIHAPGYKRAMVHVCIRWKSGHESEQFVQSRSIRRLWAEAEKEYAFADKYHAQRKSLQAELRALEPQLGAAFEASGIEAQLLTVWLRTGPRMQIRLFNPEDVLVLTQALNEWAESAKGGLYE